MADFVGRIARAMVRRAADGDLEAITALATMRQAVDAATVDAARALHDHPSAGYSWTEIGRELGVSRQAALQRFGDKAGLSPKARSDRERP